MKLYAYHSPDIPKHDGFLKIGETYRSTNKRISQQSSEANVENVPVWEGAIATEQRNIDRKFRHFLRDRYGFHIQPRSSGHGESEWVNCTVDDIKEAFPKFKELFFQEHEERQKFTNEFYKEIRNWFYWTKQENQSIDDNYTLRLVIRLLFCFFLREKNELVPKELLKADIQNYLNKDEEYSYYNGILRNLFFCCLNTSDRREYDEKLFANEKNIKGWFSAIPFLNGGLFDKHEKDDIPIGNDYFFSGRKKRTLTELDDTCYVYGIITILSKYHYKLALDNLLEKEEYDKTVDPEFIGKVFESLLSCIHEDTQKTTRQKITGSYYTPREIVDYMVNEALDSHLQNHVDLLQCKILDPACGSGAFPCAIMDELMRRLDPQQSERYSTKLKILQNVIYGVDIQPIAVQITQLRLFLSLIQEIDVNKQAHNYGIKPLPNLETKLVSADALVGLKNGRQRNLELPVVQEASQKLLDIRSRYFMESDVQRKGMYRQDDESLRKILGIALEEAGSLTHETAEKLIAWNPYDQSHSSPFFDSEWMFGVKKFDIVIGNPPYGAKYPEKQKDYFREHYVSAKTTKCNGTQTKGSLDTFSLFIENGFNNLKEGGYLMFIVPIAVVSSDSMMALHKLLFDNCKMIKVSSYAKRPVQIFHDACVANTIISLTKTNTKCERLQTTKMNRLAKRDELGQLLDGLKFTDGLRYYIRGRIPKISLPIEKRILKKLFGKSHCQVRDLLDENGKSVYYRSSGGRYYNVITNYATESTKEKPLCLGKKVVNIIGAVLSSNLFWWYQQVYSNSLDLKAYEIESFPVPIENLTQATRRNVEKLYEQYLQNIERNMVPHKTEAHKHITQYKEYKIRFSKELIDAIDDIICPLYGLTKEETEFIKNYELRFRIDK